eukprot:TRINITY_DN673_c0_g1_i1.p1 TRINITY_DN673_c0_g1~~TRINITY_DN673_c0_g1_i1.p1  ORF type:complete len:268 (-),score=50.20 TRINITY_DN673_c0_g1_i1:153-956(-)
MDADISLQLCRGLIPVRFHLIANEVTSLQPPNPCYLLVPRNSYLPLVIGSIRKYFLEAAPPIIDEMWFDFKGKPLKWHYPIGVLFDTMATPSDLPWDLTVHFLGFPSDQILRYGSEETVKRHFNNVLKEANYVKHGDCSKVYALSVSETNDLWEGVKLAQWERFLGTNAKLIPEPPALKNVPIRLFQRSNRDNLVLIQEPVNPFDDKKNPKTLGSVMAELLPNLFPNSNQPKVVIQGVSPPLNTPITWLLNNFACPDNFLYITYIIE